ncbi:MULTISPECIES: acyl carrier protein [Actinomadura]|uniref:Acyl carrier protein n=1 Tax=Actinomadura yumaensis TaxID=111807 RepID=A0ABW2CE18_9ACTN|nr:acyl carrier protein [Actinomadura sp. J1-007]MWK38281.1 acyl carrier protein [Actinomadura sp. J1-007]
MDRAKELDLTAQIKDIVIGVLDLSIDRDQLDETVSLYSPVVGLDSLSLLHILVEVEKRFDIEIDDEDVMSAELRNVGSLVQMISGVIDAKGAEH